MLGLCCTQLTVITARFAVDVAATSTIAANKAAERVDKAVVEAGGAA